MYPPNNTRLIAMASKVGTPRHNVRHRCVFQNKVLFYSLCPPTAKRKRGIVDKVSNRGSISRGMEEVERINLLQPPVVGIQIAVFGHT